MNTARLVATRVPRRPEGVVLVLHGGGEKGGEPVSARQPSVLRMIPVAARIAHAGRGRLAVYRLLNSARGWNAARTPVDDVRWALDQIGAGLPAGLPTGLAGHSLGGRAALLAAADERVTAVVALNPWVYASDGQGVRDRDILVVHGDADRIASPARSRAVADRLAGANRVEYVTVPGGNHAMLGRGSGAFTRRAAGFLTHSLLRSGPEPADTGP